MAQLNSKDLFNRSKSVTPGGVHSPVRAFKGVGGTPPFIESGRGNSIFDVEGNQYTDFCMSWGPLIFGHRDAEILSAVTEALERGWTFGTTERYSLELAELISQRIPFAEKIRFVNSGTEAVMSALRIARAATGKNKVIKFDGCYHGHHDSMLVRAGSGLAEMAVPDSAGVSTSTASDILVAPLNNLEALDEIFIAHHKEIAAIIIEPLPANNGLLTQEAEYLAKLVGLAKKYNTIVIFDEVITGFRVAFGGMAEITGLKPDLVTYGKVIGGGFPVGAYAGKKELMDLVAPQGPVYQAGTLSANPVAMVAGLSTLEKLLRDNPYPKLENLGIQLADKINSLSTNRFPIGIQTFGSLFWIVYGYEKKIRSSNDIPVRHKELFPEFFHFLLKKGLYLAPSAFEVGFLSTAHSLENIDQLAQCCKEFGERLVD